MPRALWIGIWMLALGDIAVRSEEQKSPGPPEASRKHKDPAPNPIELVRQLGDASFQTREEAEKTLESLGEQAEPFLKEAALAKDPEVVARAKHILSRIVASIQAEVRSKLSIQIEAPCRAYSVQKDLVEGKGFRLKHAIRNDSRHDVVLLRCNQDSRGERKAPMAYLEIKDERGLLVTPRKLFWNPPPGVEMPKLEEADFVTLKGGESVDLFTEPDGCGCCAGFRMPTGRYALTLVYRIQEPLEKFTREAPPGKALQTLMEQLPRLEIRSNTLTIEVTE